MHLIIALAVGSVTLSIAAAAGDQTGSPKEQYDAIVKSFGESAYAFWNVKSDDERREHVARIEKLPLQLLELAEKHPTDPVALDALTQIVTQEYWLDNYTTHSGWGTDSPQAKAIAIVTRDYLDSDRLGETCRRVQYGFRAECESFLRTVLEKSPHRQVRALACLRLAQFMKHRWVRLDLIEGQPELARRYETLYSKEYVDSLRRRDRSEATAEAEAIFERAVAEFGDVKVPYAGTVAETANSELFEIRHLSVGRLAPEIEGPDQDGKNFKLSDYRGKVVLLYFWQQL